MTRNAMRHGRRLVPLLVAAGLLLGLTGCGCGSCANDLWGNVFVDNYTDTTTVEFVDFFQIAPIGQPWTGNLLSGPLPPGSTEHVGSFHEDYYDAYAELELGDFVEWFDVFVGYGEDVFFEVY